MTSLVKMDEPRRRNVPGLHVDPTGGYPLTKHFFHGGRHRATRLPRTHDDNASDLVQVELTLSSAEYGIRQLDRASNGFIRIHRGQRRGQYLQCTGAKRDSSGIGQEAGAK